MNKDSVSPYHKQEFSSALGEQLRMFESFRQKFNQNIRDSRSREEMTNKKVFQDERITLGRYLLRVSFEVYQDIKRFSNSQSLHSTKFILWNDTKMSHLSSDYKLKVYKRILDPTTSLICADFIIPVTPQQYSAYASSLAYRHEWDSQLEKTSLLESSVDNVDVCYVALKGFSTISPRDCINLRIIKQLTDQDIKPLKDSDEIYCSCSCSIEYPHQLETKGNKVRADVRLGCYFAEPYCKDGSNSPWTRVYLFCDVDPCGWIPTIAAKHLSAIVLPRTVEKIISATLKYYHIQPIKCIS